MFAPEPKLHLVSLSPDGRWWVYADTSDDSDERVFIYNHATGKISLLSEGAYFAHSSYGLFGPAQYVYWSISAP